MAETGAPQKIAIHDADGVVTEEVTMKDGVLDGETLVYAAGQLRARLQFREGKQNGEALFYDDAGHVQTKAQYVDGKLHGDSLHFGPQGALMRKAAYQKGVLHGYTIDYYPSGKPREVSTYKENVLEGELVRLGEDGKIIERLHYHQGRLRSGPPAGSKPLPPKPGTARA